MTDTPLEWAQNQWIYYAKLNHILERKDFQWKWYLRNLIKSCWNKLNSSSDFREALLNYFVLSVYIFWNPLFTTKFHSTLSALPSSVKQTRSFQDVFARRHSSEDKCRHPPFAISILSVPFGAIQLFMWGTTHDSDLMYKLCLESYHCIN